MKKIFSLILSILLIFSLAACSSDKSGDANDESDTESAQERVFREETGSYEYQLNDEGKCEITKYLPNSVKIVDITLPQTIDGRDVVGIATGTFKAENSIKSVKIPETYTYISDYAFYDCDSLETVTFLGEKVTAIGAGAFEQCDKLASINIPKTVLTIGDFAFKDCIALTSLDLSGSVVSIGKGAFFGCKTIKTIKLSDSISEISKSAFYGCDELEYTKDDNALYLGNDSNKNLVLISAVDLDIETCTVNDSAKVIADLAFANCDMTTSVTLGKNIKKIYSTSFTGCTKLIMNESENGYYLGTSENPTMVLMSLIVPSVEDLTIGNTTIIICDKAFENCPALKNIHYAETKDEWDAVIKPNDWNNGRSIRVLFANGDVESVIYE